MKKKYYGGILMVWYYSEALSRTITLRAHQYTLRYYTCFKLPTKILLNLQVFSKELEWDSNKKATVEVDDQFPHSVKSVTFIC